jgi:hypothetical protein
MHSDTIVVASLTFNAAADVRLAKAETRDNKICTALAC